MYNDKKYEFKIVINGPVSKRYAMHLAQQAISASGANPSSGTSIDLTIKEDGKIVSERGITKGGMQIEKLINLGKS